jgi:hypothetical protein
MRIATFIIGLLVFFLMLGYSCLMFFVGGVAGFGAIGGAIGAVAALLSFLGLAFVLRLPGVAAALYLSSAFLALLAEAADFPGGMIWGLALAVLAGMAWISRAEPQGDEEGWQTP